MSKTGNVAGRARQQRMGTSYHEAGHVVLGSELGFPLGKKGVSIVPDGETAGRADIPYGTRYRPDVDLSEQARFRVEQFAMVDFAAEEAQRKFSPRSVHPYSSSGDLYNAIDNLARFHDPETLEACMKFLKLHVRQLIQKPLVWIKIVAVAEALHERKELTRAEVEEVMLGVNKKDLQQRLHMTEAEAEENVRSTNEMIRRVKQAAKKKRADARAMREHWVTWQKQQAERSISRVNVTTTDKATTTTVE